jgi:superfamily I DNA and/or RNA helicase
VDELYRLTRESAEGEAAALYEYLSDLEDDPAAVRSAVRAYTAVLAATCQQAVGFEMAQVKSDNIVFENVIVDEAARANPLDLLVPMSRARRRIVLVGDHRQLPHMLEPDVERELDGPVEDATRQALRESLFERLFHEMRDRESVDGVRRTVTLDVQYRMHPDLAKFVSDTFYAKHGESFRSGRPADDFGHDLPGYEGLIGAWVDIPSARGVEVSGRSKRRPSEARWVAKETHRLLQHNPELSIGVISFYSAQVTEILRAMEGLELAESTGAESLRVADAWRETRGQDGRLKERLRVGTVDAFQGKEFDVVILSMTRSNDISDPDGTKARRRFGHLMLENRLCVAMSRQQRLLIVAGDAEMVQGPWAGDAVPGLVAFWDLCGGERGARLHL